MAHGPARGLEIADRLAGHPALASYPHLPAVRGDLLAKLGRAAEAREEFVLAAALTANEREKALFQARADACQGSGSSSAGSGSAGSRSAGSRSAGSGSAGSRSA
jgi:predicted RNA polymerase sigma factor